MTRFLVSLAVAAAVTVALAEGLDQELKINDTLSTELAIEDQEFISIRSAGLIDVDVDGGVETRLFIQADMPERNRNDITRTPAAAIGNAQINCEVEDVTGFFPDTREFLCDTRAVTFGVTNRVCVGFTEAFQFGVRNLGAEQLAVYASNRCIDFPGL